MFLSAPLQSVAPVLDPSQLEALRDLDESGDGGLVREVVELFLADTPVKLAALKAAVHDLSAPSVFTSAHALRGSLLAIGACRLATVCDEIETDARNGKLTAALRHDSETLDRDFEAVTQALRSLAR